MTAYKIRCPDCNSIISGKGKRFCSNCLKDHIIKYNIDNRERILKYNRNYNIYKRKGTGGLGPHRNKDFKRELELVKREKNTIFKYGSRSIAFTKPYTIDKEDVIGERWECDL